MPFRNHFEVWAEIAALPYWKRYDETPTLAPEMRGEAGIFDLLLQEGHDVYCNGLSWCWNTGKVEIEFHAGPTPHVTITEQDNG